MDRKTKALLLFGSALISLVYAVTTPTIEIYFMRLVSPQVLALANMLSVGLAAAVNSTVPIERLKELYRRNFLLIVVVDVVCFWLISMQSMADPTVRFIGFAVLNAVSTTLWVVIMRNAINRVIDGDKLTDWQSITRSAELYAALVGGVIAFCVVDFDVMPCLVAQSVANMLLGVTDIMAFKRLTKELPVQCKCRAN